MSADAFGAVAETNHGPLRGLKVLDASTILAGPLAAGKWISVQNVAGSLAGIVAPIITGLVVDRTGQFYWAFVVAAGMAMLGVIGWGLMIRRIAPVEWASSEPA